MGSGKSTKYEKTYFYKSSEAEPQSVAERAIEYGTADTHTIESHNDERVMKFCEDMVSRRPHEESSYAQNLTNTAQHFEMNDRGLFGRSGENKGIRIIQTYDPMESAMTFFRELGDGGLVKYSANRHGIISYLGDGIHILFRPYPKTVGSPAVDIFITSSGNLLQKIHFIGI